MTRAGSLTTSAGCFPMTEAVAKIAWLPFDPRDWVPLTPAFGRYRSLVDEPNTLVANTLAATCFDRDVHDGRLELALVALDGTYRLFDATERRKLHIGVPLNYQEGCRIEPYYEGRWYARRSDLDRLTTIPSPVARVEAELAPAKTPSIEPASSGALLSPPAEPPQPPQSSQVKPALPTEAPEQSVVSPGSAPNSGDQTRWTAGGKRTAGRPPAAWRNELHRLIDAGLLDPNLSNNDIARRLEGVGNTSPTIKTILNVLGEDEKFLAWRAKSNLREEK